MDGSVALAALDQASVGRADALAQALALENIVLDSGDWHAHAGHACLLLVSETGLALGMTGSARVRPVQADFADPALWYRLRGPGARREDLARALGVYQRRALRVIDATAGWGRDSAVLAALGCEVFMIERQPVIAALLDDALARARRSDRDEVRLLAARLTMIPADACSVLREWTDPPPDAVLLDPMFPQRHGSAAVRKEMQFFQALVGSDDDAPALLEAALRVALHRVVVKRPRKAPPLAGPPPGHAIEGRSTRFDIYALRKFA